MKVKEAEIKEIRRIVDRINDEGDYFYERLHKGQKHTMFFNFWEKHYEWTELKNFPEIGGHIMDFGCGSGHSDVLLAANGYKVHGIDNSRTGIAIAEYLRKIQPEGIRKNVSFECLNIDKDTTERDVKYDSVWSAHVFEHIEDPTEVFLGLKKLVKPKAKMLISVPYRDCYKHPTHVHYWYSDKELRVFLGQFIEVIDVKVRTPVLRALCVF